MFYILTRCSLINILRKIVLQSFSWNNSMPHIFGPHIWLGWIGPSLPLEREVQYHIMMQRGVKSKMFSCRNYAHRNLTVLKNVWYDNLRTSINVKNNIKTTGNSVKLLFFLFLGISSNSLTCWCESFEFHVLYERNSPFQDIWRISTTLRARWVTTCFRACKQFLRQLNKQR